MTVAHTLQDSALHYKRLVLNCTRLTCRALAAGSYFLRLASSWGGLHGQPEQFNPHASDLVRGSPGARQCNQCTCDAFQRWQQRCGPQISNLFAGCVTPCSNFRFQNSETTFRNHLDEVFHDGPIPVQANGCTECTTVLHSRLCCTVCSAASALEAPTICNVMQSRIRLCLKYHDSRRHGHGTAQRYRHPPGPGVASPGTCPAEQTD